MSTGLWFYLMKVKSIKSICYGAMAEIVASIYTDKPKMLLCPSIFFKYGILLFGLTFYSCHVNEREHDSLFRLLGSEETGVDFENTLTYTNEFNIYKYRNYYNGGGVGLGDINNDGLLDIYLVANLLPNRLYINKGNLQFEDVSAGAQIGGKRAWSTGVTMVDINADGWLDIYVCNSGDVRGDDKRNEFFINNGDGTFTDRAKELGLDDPGFSTHATFFDYDKDGDLDVYLLNNSYRAIGSFNLKKNERPKRDQLGGDKLFRNEDGVFKDVSLEAGIYQSVIGFALGVSVSDLDKDGWADLYISNDFFERDYIYMNNRDGTFREELEKQMRSISLASMGSDIADMNNDGYPDVFVTEMLPEGEERFKTTMTFENWDKYIYNLENGYYHQFTRNMLHRHNGIIPGRGVTFSEVGRYAKVEATDWSWSSLLADLDNDGFKDLYIANGLAQDILNQDYLQYISDKNVIKMIVSDRGVDYDQLIEIIPVSKISNYTYSGNGEFGFEDVTQEWGLHKKSHSNGAAYGDLDNDGDLDLVVNNVNMPVFVYENQTNRMGVHTYLKFILHGERKNLAAYGTKITVKTNGETIYMEQFPTRGFQSSVDNRINIGLGKRLEVDTVIIDWPYGTKSILTDVRTNQTLELHEKEGVKYDGKTNNPVSDKSMFKEVFVQESFRHHENKFVDFHKDKLLFHMISAEGPKMAIADVNGDGLMDYYIGGAKDFEGALLLQKSNGHFVRSMQEPFMHDKASEDVSCVFFDADGDGDEDLYVVSGGSEFVSTSFALVDRLYLNDGTGNMSRSGQLLPVGKPVSTSVVRASDFDRDGDLDLFVGGRLKSGLIGVPQDGYLLENDGDGNFTNVTKDLAGGMLGIGMIRDAVWTDFDMDNDDDIIIIGEWMNIKVFENREGNFYDVTKEAQLSSSSGWWNTIESEDLDGDGDPDYVIGNHGLNSRFRASKHKPVTCYVNDFDQNGIVEQIICTYKGDKSYPMMLRHDFVMQMPTFKSRFAKYASFKGLTITDIFSESQIGNSIKLEAKILESILLINNGDGTFRIEPLPKEVQLAPVYAIKIYDFDKDENLDILLGGNLFEAKPEVGRYDASYGVFLRGKGNGDFIPISNACTGLALEGQVRDIEVLEVQGKDLLTIVRNNEKMQFFDFEMLESLWGE
ncbi:MAG: VCBS repeat-containing protein [Cytophagales bacterium]|nr:VCBS repeat-containing protein [Cytophagales bacterium]